MKRKKFAEKYVIPSNKGLDSNDPRITISEDAFALGEMLSEILDKLEHLRLNSKSK